MPEADVLYSDVKFTRGNGKTTGTLSSSADTTYSEVKISKTHPSTEPHAGSPEDGSSRSSKVTPERVAVLVLSVLLAAAVIALSVTIFDNMTTKQTLRNLKMNGEDVDKMTHCETKPCSTVQPVCPQPPAVTLNDQCLKCEVGWEQHEGQCYYFSTEKSSWKNSRSDCQRRGGDLVKMNSKEEQTFLERRLREVMMEAHDKFWIGLTDSQTEGEWLWVDGSPLDTSLTFWSSKEPDNWKDEDPDGEDCVRMGEKAGAHDLKCWFDKSCIVPHRSICEKPAGSGHFEAVCV